MLSSPVLAHPAIIIIPLALLMYLVKVYRNIMLIK
jgi:hypothetical protein